MLLPPTTPPGGRDCTATATARPSPIALCPSCEARCPTVRKGEAAVTLHASALDVLDWLQTATTRLTHAERVLASAVTRARQAGHSWAAIDTRFNITRQAAQQRFRTQVRQPPRAHPPASQRPHLRARIDVSHGVGHGGRGLTSRPQHPHPWPSGFPRSGQAAPG